MLQVWLFAPAFVWQWYLPRVCCGSVGSPAVVLDCFHLSAFFHGVHSIPLSCFFFYWFSVHVWLFFFFLMVKPIYLPRWKQETLERPFCLFWGEKNPTFLNFREISEDLPPSHCSLLSLLFPQFWLLKRSELFESLWSVSSLCRWCQQAVVQMHCGCRLNWETLSFHSQHPQAWGGGVVEERPCSVCCKFDWIPVRYKISHNPSVRFQFWDWRGGRERERNVQS